MRTSTIAVAVTLALMAATAGGYLILQHKEEPVNEGAAIAGVFMLKDKAVAWRTAEDYKQFRYELRGFEASQKEGFAASWITSGKAVLLPQQEATLICLDEPLAVVRTTDGEVWVTLISQIEGDEAESDNNIIEDRIAQMIEGK